ncbi:MAG TPA: tRNA epoxyqueuosine(34) reductase QueG [Lacunisphaera sp.]|nr:tRNA epoxyqueuosine(34) reductase QueG [Lacunisphaera sp.]
MTTVAGRAEPDSRREELRARLRGLGFDEVRFASVGSVGAGLEPWLESGHHADMQWMERTAAKRLDPELVLAGTQTVIVLGIDYGGPEVEPADQRPRWARYALHADYHDTVKEGLVRAGRELEAWGELGPADYRYYVDTGPVMERGWAARSGLGFRGKNGMLISRRHGNWLFLAAILTRARIAPDEPLRPHEARVGGSEPAGLLCGKCTRCLDACPTAAFPRPGVVDSRRCISYHTIENRGIIPREFRSAIGDRIYGCDVCLEVCPWNRFAAAARRVLLSVRADIAQLELAQLLDLTPERFAAQFKGTAIKRLKLAGLLRNACVVAGNSGDAAHVPALVRLAAHAAPVVRAHAVWAVRKLAGQGAGALLANARASENEATVLAEYAG